jgi:hypothetical protein
VTITGPRQSGKTTLCREVFKRLPYVSLEPIDIRTFAQDDPREFLDEYRRGAIIDEVQHAPELLSYIQEEVDARPRPGRFVLTGSQNLGMLANIGQSLAGRTAVLHLLPLGLDELRRFESAPTDLLPTLWAGAYPRIHDRKIPANRWLADYVTTYVQRDVRQLLNVGDLEAFTTFVRLCAGRTAQEVNLSALGADAGVSHNTARSWLSILEACFLVFRVPPWLRNVRKQIVKSPKLHFFDSGLVCSLLGITNPEQLRHHPLRGPIFESWVAAEVYKARVHRGLDPRLFHYREAKGLEVDLIVDRGADRVAVEAKSGATAPPDAFRALVRFAASMRRPKPQSIVVFGGERSQRRKDGQLVSWRAIQDIDWD